MRRRSVMAPTTRQHNAGASSQEEFEESESESDRVMTSSNEAIHASPLQHEWRPDGRHFTLSSASSEAYGSEEDENATAINMPRGEQAFTPQPNIFSHPASSHRASTAQQSTNSYFGSRSTRQQPRTSYSNREQHTPYNIISSSHHADHDAALRASLSTLLSCAAAARALPKTHKPATESGTRQVSSNHVDPMSIGLMPESAIYGTSPAKATTQSTTHAATPGAATMTDKAKRKDSTQQRSNSKDRRATKKVKRSTSTWTPATMEEVNPTLMTWFVGASVIVLVSALGFSAGYITGKEAGRAEVLELGAGAAKTGCGKRAMVAGAGRSLRPSIMV